MNQLVYLKAIQPSLYPADLSAASQKGAARVLDEYLTLSHQPVRTNQQAGPFTAGNDFLKTRLPQVRDEFAFAEADFVNRMTLLSFIQIR